MTTSSHTALALLSFTALAACNIGSRAPGLSSSSPSNRAQPPRSTAFAPGVLDATAVNATVHLDANGGGDRGTAEGEGEGAEGEGEGTSAGGGAGEGEGEGEGSSAPPQFHTILMIGNSQLGADEFHANLAQALEELSVAVDGTAHMLVDRVQEDGKDCQGFLDAQTPLARAGSGDYDVVLLFPDLSEPKPGSVAYFDTFRTVSTGAGAVFGLVATASFSGEYPQGFTSLNDGLRAYAQQNPGTLFVPAGNSFEQLLQTDSPTLHDLYMLYSDLAHPGVRGYGLYLYTLWGVLRGGSSAGLPRDFPALRCDLTLPCLTQAELEACAAAGTCDMTQNGVEPDGNNEVAVETADEQAAYQVAADAAVTSNAIR